MITRLRSIREKLKSSLFYTPMILTMVGLGLGQLFLWADQQVTNIPTGLTATVDSARAVLGVIAGATIAFAGIAFSVSLLLISLSSSQYSPRVVHGLFRDPFNKRVMGVVIGTFTYCLVVLRAVRSPLDGGGEAVIPSLSIAVALLLGITTILAIVAFISHAAHSMDISKILHGVTEAAIAEVSAQWGEGSDTDAAREESTGETAPDDAFVVTFERSGWVQQVDHSALLRALEPGATMWLDTVAGRYAIVATPLCRIVPTPSDPDVVERRVRHAIGVGQTRTAQGDVTYGLRQLADVALKALSPGINDPTTAQDAMFHLGAVLRELLVRNVPTRHLSGEEGRELLIPRAWTHAEIVGLAFDEIRLASAGMPTVQIYLLEILHLLTTSIASAANGDEATAALRSQADLALEVSEMADLPALDHERVRSAHRDRFESATSDLSNQSID
ncbi:MAG: DUF2254 domain-containing protein [Actinobacteria bacterium]|nr:DUF2254 domain-containing protein [Actinomycetota bacterium]